MAIVNYQYRVDGGAPVNAGLDFTEDVTGLAPVSTDFEMRSEGPVGVFSAWSPVISATPLGEIFAYLVGAEATSSFDNSTTPAINTTGADLFVIAVAYLADGAPVVSDSESNAWTAGTEYTSGAGNGRLRLYWCANPITDANHTFTCIGSNSFHSMAVGAFGGSVDSTPVDGEVGAGSASATTQQPGSITPSINNCLLVSGVLYVGTADATINSGFTIGNTLGDASNFSVGLAYKIQTTAGAENPTWSSNGAADRMAAATLVFKET